MKQVDEDKLIKGKYYLHYSNTGQYWRSRRIQIIRIADYTVYLHADRLRFHPPRYTCDNIETISRGFSNELDIRANPPVTDVKSVFSWEPVPNYGHNAELFIAKSDVFLELTEDDMLGVIAENL